MSLHIDNYCQEVYQCLKKKKLDFLENSKRNSSLIS